MSQEHRLSYSPLVMLAVFVMLCTACLCMQPSPAFADDPQLENSWRYDNGQIVSPDDSDLSDTESNGSSSGVNGLGIRHLSASAASDLTYSEFGVDVSYHNGKINWSTAKEAGVSYAIVRCGYGQDIRSQDDSQWLNNVRGCQENDIPLGVYLYSYATSADGAVGEANHVISQLKSAGLSPSDLQLPIYLDMEDRTTQDLSKSQYAAIFNAFQKTLYDAGYERVGVYANCNWWQNKLSLISLDADLKWAARYYSNRDYQPGSNGFAATPFTQPYASLKGSAALWQYCSAGKVPGISGSVDVDLASAGLVRYGVPHGSVTMYRLYNPYTGEHFYTSDFSERNSIIAVGWQAEGVGWYAPENGDPVYRLYNPFAGEHHYTMSASERDNLVQAGWNYEGIGWYSADESVSNRTMVYREYNPFKYAWNHNYTVDPREHSSLIQSGWNDEGVAWYGVAAS